MQSVVLGHLDLVNPYKYPELHEDLGPIGSVHGSPLPEWLAAGAVPPGRRTAGASLLKCGLQPFCSRRLRPEEGKVAHPHQYSNSWSLYFEITLSNAGNKQKTAVREHEKTMVPTTVSF